MKDIFANLYNKVVSFFHQTDEKSASNAKDVACNRLKLVLMQDRTNLTPAIMDRMRKELIELLSKYMELDRELLDLNFEHEDDQMALMLSIPVIRAKNEDEINEILAKEDEEKAKIEELTKASEGVNEEVNDEEGVNEGVNEGGSDDESDNDEDSDEDSSDDDEDDEDDDEETPEHVKKEKFFSKKKKSKGKKDNSEENNEEPEENNEDSENEE